MTDRTHPDSGRATGGIVQALQARIADLEAQLASIGAGGVSGPLIGQPQAMPDLSQLTEIAAASKERRRGMLSDDRIAEMMRDTWGCASIAPRHAEAFARSVEAEVRKDDEALMRQLSDALEWLHLGIGPARDPMRAITTARARLLDSDLSNLTERGAAAWAGVDAQALREGFTAADMATAEARGFRDGAASAMAGEPMAWMTFTEEGDPDMVFLDRLEACQYCEDDDPPKPLYLAAPPTAQADGWQSIETAPKDGRRILVHPAIEAADAWSKAHWSAQNECWIVGGSPSGVLHTAWHPLPPPPTSAEGVEP